MIKATGYIIHDKSGTAIYGSGATPDEAWRMVVDGVGTFHDGKGDDVPADEARSTQFVTLPATAALLAQVEERGGAITWGRIGIIACTTEEEEAAA